MQGNIFNEQTLRNEIINTWGAYGAHLEVFDELLHRAEGKTTRMMFKESALAHEEDKHTFNTHPATHFVEITENAIDCYWWFRNHIGDSFTVCEFNDYYVDEPTKDRLSSFIQDELLEPEDCYVVHNGDRMECIILKEYCKVIDHGDAR